jgi:A/G-specific adenine glycosylase
VPGVVTSRSTALLRWYGAGHRRFPWRDTTDPYAILVSEVMLQQTPAARVVPAYERFLERFPNPESLAAAELREVLSVWQGLGYPIRARRLREAAALIASAGWPRTSAGLRALPGVGPYTAAAVASFAFGERAAALDTNARRVLSRWHGEALSRSRLARAAADDLPGDAAQWNQAVMELGATLCRPDAPRCGDCPVARWCADPEIYVPPPRQASFDGSLRQVRGAVLREVTAQPLTIDRLAETTGFDPERVREAVITLSRDGLVAVDRTGVVS